MTQRRHPPRTGAGLRGALLFAVLVSGCASASGHGPDLGGGGDGATGPFDAAVISNGDLGPALDGATDGPGSVAAYRTSLGTCWLDATCTRALLIAHGGEWALNSPAYGSKTAFEKAFADGADGIKADVRFSKDGVPVVVHSSPFQLYEIQLSDFACLNKKVEDMLVADIVQCHWINGDAIQRLDDLINWARGKQVVMLTVKDTTTVPQSIAAVVALNATDFAFLEISTSLLMTVVPTAPDGDKVYYLIEAATQGEIDSLITLNNKRAFMYEDANLDSFGGLSPAAVTSMINGQLHPAGVRAFSYVKSNTAAVQDHTALWDQGYDVLMTNSLPTGLQARIALNMARGIAPP